MKKMNFIEYIYDSNKSQNSSELADTFTKFIGNFGIDSFVMAEIAGDTTSDKEDGFGIMVNYPEDWLEHYIANHYIEHDPVYQMSQTSRSPFTWKEIMETNTSQMQKKVMNEAKEFGLCNGIGMPVFKEPGKMIGFGLSSSKKDIRSCPDTLSVLHASAFQLTMVYEKFQEKGISKNSKNLTPREREVLLWIANGKTKSETARKLSVSESCIKRHCENIFEKLGVNNLPHAVCKALNMGFINPY